MRAKIVLGGKGGEVEISKLGVSAMKRPAPTAEADKDSELLRGGERRDLALWGYASFDRRPPCALEREEPADARWKTPTQLPSEKLQEQGPRPYYGGRTQRIREEAYTKALPRARKTVPFLGQPPSRITPPSLKPRPGRSWKRSWCNC